MNTCLCCGSNSNLYTVSDGSLTVCFQCLNVILKENPQIKEIKTLKEQKENLEKENAKLRNILCGCATKF